VGVSIFLLWVVTRRGALIPVGIYTILGGLVCFVAGVIALVRFWRLGRRVPDLPRTRLRRSVLVAALLLLSNFPAAGAIVYAAAAIESCYAVTVRNVSGRRIENARVFGGGCDVSFGAVGPGESTRRWFWVEREGSLMLDVDGKETVLDGYVCAGMGGRVTATIRTDGAVAVDWARR
jgi:hypothetical protein